MTDTNKEREAFEAFVRKRWGGSDRGELRRQEQPYIGYVNGSVDFAWAAYQAGRASLAASAGSEPVAGAVLDSEGSVCLIRRGTERDYIARRGGSLLYTHPSPPEGAGWRPIETAPTDEMYRDGPNAYAEYILVWYPGAMAPIRARWWQSDSGRRNFLADGSYAVFPTVWMPLPAPPASEAKGA